MDVLDLPTGNIEQKNRTLDEVLREGYEFELGEHLGRIFQLLKPSWALLVGNTAIMFAAIVVIEVIAMAVFIGSMDMSNPEAIISNPAGLFANMLVIYGVIALFMLVFVVPLRAGIFVFLNRGTASGNYNFGDFFEPFRTRWAKLAGMYFVIVLISYLWVLVPYYFMLEDIYNNMANLNEDPESAVAMMGSFRYMGWVLLGYIPMLYFLISYSLAVPLLLFQTDDVWKALEGSRKLVNRKGYFWFLFLAFYIVLALLAVSGIIACGIGLLLTINAIPLGIYAVYEHIFRPQRNL